MEPILDETSLVPCRSVEPGTRIRTLACTLKGLDDLGVPRVLRSVRDAVDRDIGDGKGLRVWFFDHRTDRDARQFVASRLGKQPFIDGADGLFSLAEGGMAVEGKVEGKTVFGLALAAINDSIAVLFGSCSESDISAGTVDVSLTRTNGETFFEEEKSIRCFAVPRDVETHRLWIIERVKKSIENGVTLIERATEVFPRLRFGEKAIEQVRVLIGSEPFFPQLLRHLYVLDKEAREWRSGSFSPGGLTWSSESSSTLNHPEYGPKRDFPVPDGFKTERWSNHTKLTGSGCYRLYFRFEQKSQDGSSVVLIGYFGPHLPTTDYPT